MVISSLALFKLQIALAANQPPVDLQTAVAGAADDPQHVGRLVRGRDQRARRHGRQLLGGY